MDSKTIIKVINEKPARFFKNLLTYYLDQDLLSGLIPKLYKDSEYQWAEEFEKYRDNPNKGAKIGNIFKTLMKEYPYDDFDYGTKDYLQIAQYIFKNYNKRIEKYMNKKAVAGYFKDKGKHDPHTALREQVARGFIIDSGYKMLKGIDQRYIKSTLTPDLVYPKLVNTLEEAITLRDKMGITGYTGISERPDK